MDKKTALSFVERIEAHKKQEDAVWEEMREHPEYETHEDKVVASIISARAKASALLDEAEADLGSFDWVEDESGDLVHREEIPA